MLKIRAWILLGVLLFIDGVFVTANAGSQPLWLTLALPPLAVLTTGFGLDICRESYRAFLKGRRDPSEGSILLLLCLIVMPLPLALSLASIDLLLPGLMANVHGLLQAWGVATGVTLVSAFLRLQDYPISLRALRALFVEAYKPGEV